jgi:hypothetical protein
MKRVTLILSIVGLFASVSSTADAALPDDIVLFMTFDEGSGTDVHDASRYGNHGEATNASWADGKHGGGFELDSGTFIMVEPSDVLTELKAPISVGFWIKPFSFPQEWIILVAMESSPGVRANGWKAGIRFTNPVFTIWGVKDHTATATVEKDIWTHITCTYDGTTVKFYINGEFDSEDPGSGEINVTQSPGLNIGAKEPDRAIKGIIDELWVSNVVKTQEEIQELMEPAKLILVEPGGKTAATWGVLKL